MITLSLDALVVRGHVRAAGGSTYLAHVRVALGERGTFGRGAAAVGRFEGALAELTATGDLCAVPDADGDVVLSIPRGAAL